MKKILVLLIAMLLVTSTQVVAQNELPDSIFFSVIFSPAGDIQVSENYSPYEAYRLPSINSEEDFSFEFYSEYLRDTLTIIVWFDNTENQSFKDKLYSKDIKKTCHIMYGTALYSIKEKKCSTGFTAFEERKRIDSPDNLLSIFRIIEKL